MPFAFDGQVERDCLKPRFIVARVVGRKGRADNLEGAPYGVEVDWLCRIIKRVNRGGKLRWKQRLTRPRYSHEQDFLLCSARFFGRQRAYGAPNVDELRAES